MFSLKGKSLNKKFMVMAMKVLNYFRRTDVNARKVVTWITANACGISVRTVYRIKNQFGTASLERTSVSSPQRKRVQQKLKSTYVDDFVKSSIRHKIYTNHNKLLPVILENLKKELREDDVFNFSTSSLRR